MKLLAIYDTWHKPIKKVDFGIEYAYLVRANCVFTASDETEIPSMDGTDCAIQIIDRLESAGFCEIRKTIDAKDELLDALKTLKAALGPDGEYSICRTDGKTMNLAETVFVGDWFEKADKAIRKAEPQP